SVSKYLTHLEEHLGVRLLHRTTRQLSLTPEGEAYYERCVGILEEVAATEDAMANLHAKPRGTLRINAPMSFGILHLSPAISDFLTLYPEISIELSLTDRFVDVVDEGVDVAVRIGRLEDSGLFAKRLAPCRIVACASPTYLAREGKPTTLEELSKHHCLIYSYHSQRNEWKFIQEGKPVTVPVQSRLRVNNGDVLRLAALQGLGIMAAPTFLVGEDLQAGRLQTILSDFSIPEPAIHAIYAHNRHLSTKVRVFIDFLAERFGPKPYWDLPLEAQGP
ncbi:MAG: LysR family transcriptional regulator, partial [Magnetococcales bacterium]|nr:LysR family transcriptional regulator [Magnetococcales bacterium]